MLELEAGHPEEARKRCAELTPVAARMGEGSEGPFSAALQALVALASGGAGADQRLDTAADALPAAGAGVVVPTSLPLPAHGGRRAGRAPSGRGRAEEGLRAAEVVGRCSDVALAHAVLARAGLADRDLVAVEANLEALRRDLERPSDLSARARAAAEAALAAGV